MNDTALDLELLDALNLQRDYPLSERLLCATIDTMGGRPTEPDRIRARLCWLQGKGWVTTLADEHGTDRWLITTKGIAYLARK